MEKGAILSECRRYRYALWRIWDKSVSYAVFIALNPSTADETNDDRTVDRCIGFASSWGYGGVYVANLFAYRSPNRRILKIVEDPVGKDNDKWLVRLSQKAGIVVAAWGNDGTYMNRDKEVLAMLPDLYYLALNKSGQPAHPLYLKGNLKPIPFS